MADRQRSGEGQKSPAAMKSVHVGHGSTPATSRSKSRPAKAWALIRAIAQFYVLLEQTPAMGSKCDVHRHHDVPPHKTICAREHIA